MIGKLLCRLGRHDFAHAGYVAWNMYRISCTRGCGQHMSVVTRWW